jgi:hypothetical protein
VVGVAGQSGGVTGVASGGRAYRTVIDWVTKTCTGSMFTIYAWLCWAMGRYTDIVGVMCWDIVGSEHRVGLWYRMGEVCTVLGRR